MKFGYRLPNIGGQVSPDAMVQSGVLAEELGYVSLWVADHVVAPRAYAAGFSHLLEALILMAHVAAKTDKVELGTSVLVLPYRDPILVAKQVASIDQLSHGRVALAVGAGWMKEEFDLLGVDYNKRGRLLDESIKLMRQLWTGEVVNFSGRLLSVKDAISLPKPAHHVPIYIGGASDAALNRVVKLGDGWHPLGLSPEEVAQAAKRLRASKKDVTITLRLCVDLREGATPKDEAGTRVDLFGKRASIVSRIEEYERAGVDVLIPDFIAPDDAALDGQLRSFAKEIMSSFA